MMLKPSSIPSNKCSTGAGVVAAAADTGAGVVAADTGAGVAAADTGAGVAVDAVADIGAGAAVGNVRFQPASQVMGQTADAGRPVISSFKSNTSAR
jgi:hypothetical protein